LSLPAEIRIPQQYIVNLTPDSPLNWSKPLSRVDRRKSLNEIGFGKIESYQKGTILGEGTYAIVYEGKSSLTSNKVALKEIRLDYEEGAPCTAIRYVIFMFNRTRFVAFFYFKRQFLGRFTLMVSGVKKNI